MKKTKLKKLLANAMLYTINVRNVDRLCDLRRYERYNVKLGKEVERMEEKLLELIKTAMECEKVSNKIYAEIHYLWGNEIEIDIRSKQNFSYIYTSKIDLVKDIFTIDDVIKKIKKLTKEEN